MLWSHQRRLDVRQLILLDLDEQYAIKNLHSWLVLFALVHTENWLTDSQPRTMEKDFSLFLIKSYLLGDPVFSIFYIPKGGTTHSLIPSSISLPLPSMESVLLEVSSQPLIAMSHSSVDLPNSWTLPC